MAEQPVTLTPPELAKRWRVKPEKIRNFCRDGSLRAFDISSRPGVGRPRYRIPLDAIIEFENKRTAKTPHVRRRKRKPQPDVIQFF